MNTIEDALTFDDTFTSEDRFFFAAALTEYNSDTEIIEEKRYGELVLGYHAWGDGYEGTRRLDYHYCTDEELGFDTGLKTEIFPIFSLAVTEL